MSVINQTCKNFLDGFLIALSFLTIIPLPKKSFQNHPDFSTGLIWFPVIGVLIGVLACALSLFFEIFFPQTITAIITVAFLSGISGFLHIDGLADTADGFFSSRPQERILEIMKDSRIGPMGVILLIVVFFTKFSAFSLPQYNTIGACLILPLAGRSSIILQMALLPYARKTGTGIGDLFHIKKVKTAAFGAVLFLLVSCLIFTSIPFLIVGLFGLFNFLFAAFCKNKISGYTGDTLGAACEVSETLVAVSFCIGM